MREDSRKKHCLILPLALIPCFMPGCKDKKAMAKLQRCGQISIR
jgi:hypothetical protein